jgi:hypothetical protein
MILPDGWFTEENIKEYRRLVSEIPDGGTLCELGVWQGRSLCSVADLILKKKIKVIAVDTFKGTDAEGDAHKFAKQNDLYKVFQANVERFGLDVMTYEMTTHEASKCIQQDIDLLFIDAGHTYEDVKEDIEDWLPLVKGTIAGHDYSPNWPGVIKAVDEHFKPRVVSDIWSRKMVSILAYISTKNRYDSTLPLAMTAIAMQTVKPERFILFDDNDSPRDLRDSETYQYIFKLFEEKGISWEVMWSAKKGQHHNHEYANTLDHDLCWRVDDDEIPEATCLENLLKEMGPKVGAVAGLVIQPQLSSEGNLQWYKWDGESKKVEDLYSSFLYRPNVAHYDLRLSPVAHREETMFTKMLKDKGYDLVVTPKAITWHFRASGGIRSGQGAEMFDHDEDVYKATLDFQKTGKKLVVNNGGIGDNYMMLQAIKLPPKCVVATTYPEVYKDVDVEIISIAEAMKICDVEHHNIYAWCAHKKWKGTLIEAYKKLYEDINI